MEEKEEDVFIFNNQTNNYEEMEISTRQKRWCNK
jgi:hypothetical protein